MNEADVLGKVTRRLLPFMFVLYIVSYLDRINVSFVALQMRAELGMDEAAFGFGAGIFFVGYCLFGVPSNMLVARLGARRWISILMVAWGIVSVSLASVHSAHEFYVLRFLLGIAEAGFFPGMILYLTYWYPKRQHGLAVARFMSAIPVAGVLGGLIASRVLLMNGILGLAGWKWAFIITGTPSILLGFATSFYLTDRPELAHWLTKEERDWLLDRLASDREAAVQNQADALQAFFNARVWHLALVYFSLVLGMYGYQLWLPQIMAHIGGQSESRTALLSCIPAALMALGMLTVARHSDHSGERRWHLAASAAFAAVGLIVAAWLQNPLWSLCALSLAAFGIWGTLGPFWALPTAYLSPASAACGIGLINSFGNLGGCAGPWLVGIIKSHSSDFNTAMYALAASLVLGGLLALAVLPGDSVRVLDLDAGSKN